jgi:hypothetical protein
MSSAALLPSLWKSDSGDRERHSGVGRNPFAFPPESCSRSPRNGVRVQPGIVFAFTPESPSRCSGFLRLVAEYTKAMELCKLKSSTSFFETVVIPSLEVAENLIKLRWSKVAQIGISTKQRKVDLLETELKATGRECAYIFEARKRFPEQTPLIDSERFG